MDWFTFSGALPSSAEKWKNALLVALGALLGWVRSPPVWLVAGPLRTVALLLGSVSQESGYNSSVCGDGGASCGVLQFKQATIEALGGTDEDRQSPFWSGYYGVRMIARGLTEKAGWWKIGIPGYGFAVNRWLWRSGWGGDPSKAWAQQGIGGSYPEPRAWGAWLLWRSLTLVVGFVALMAFRRWRAARGAGRGAGRR